MDSETKLSTFAKYAWFVLGYNLLVILWGVFLRASKSGDGCGQHWLTCHGEVIPSAPELKTVIEFSHRVTSALDGLIVIAMVVWAVRIYRRGRTESDRRVMKAAIGSLAFVIVEGLLGAGLVLTGNTAGNLTDARPFWAMGHLITTLILLTFLTLTAWWASGGGELKMKAAGPRFRLVLVLGILAFLLVGLSGSVAALSNLLFPSQTLAEGIAKDFSPTSNFLLRLRLSHPIVSIFAAVFLIFASDWLRKESGKDRHVSRWANVASLLLIVQLFFGGATLLTLAPIVMQVGHLLLADFIWIALVLMVANFLARTPSGPDSGTAGT